MNNEDYEDTGYGSLGGSAIESHNKIKTLVAKEGVQYTVPCDGCGREIGLMVPWLEVLYLSTGNLPPNNSWRHDSFNLVFVPNTSHCRNEPIRLGITPDECTRHIKSGLAARYLSPEAVQRALAQIQPQRG